MTKFDYTTYEGDDPTPCLEALGMKPIDDDAKHGDHLLLLVDFGMDWEGGMGGALEDRRRYGLLIGNNGLHNTGEDFWDFAGWNWSQDCYEGWNSFDHDNEPMPKVIGYRHLIPDYRPAQEAAALPG